mmetsp:Transcript_18645/g.45859  ORF Transcript_18645/g.45859 Transcript_18645/m.45859 type:complete len:553 (-) Transcript_18645:95-1753(-)
MSSYGSDASMEDLEEEQDDDYLFDEDEDPQSSSMNRGEKTYIPLTAEAIEIEQKKAIQQVIDLTQLKPHVARQLLQEMRWSYEALAELYFEDPEKLLSKAGAAVDGEAVDSAALRRSDSQPLGDEEVTCQVCWDSCTGDEVAEKMTWSEPCGHVFCNDCWRRHLRVQIEDENQAARIPCAGETVLPCGKTGRCNIVVDENVVERLLAQGEDKALLKKYRVRLLETYVNNNPHVKWCPGRDCTNAVRITNDFDLTGFMTHVECSDEPSTAHKWCFNCKEEPHVPAECSDVIKWKKKCQDDSETCNWLQANTKDCPKCKVSINKDGGCNHIHCKQCDHHFCWVCLGPFEHTTYQHTCNKFVQDESSINSSRAALERYMHHFERFSNHLKSREFESQMRENALKKMEEMQLVGNKTYMDVQFMKQATSQLIEARQILQWTYVVGFYEPAWLIRNIFELNQAELEGAVEKLSNMLEQEDVIRWCEELERVQMINQTNQVKTRLEHLFAHLEEWKNTRTEPLAGNEPDGGDGGGDEESKKGVKRKQGAGVVTRKNRK